VLRRFLCVILCIILLFLESCHSKRVLLSPLPSQVKTIEGHASLRITTEQKSTRSKFSFLFCLPEQGKVDVSDLLGRTLYQIIIDEKKAFLVVPSKKVFWKGEEEEILNKFLGFPLNLYEMICLLTGEWEREADFGKLQSESEEWVFEKDQKGRIISGNRRELHFEVESFIDNSSFVRVLVFRHPLSSGRIKIINIAFNRFNPGKPLLTFSLSGFREETLSDILEKF